MSGTRTTVPASTPARRGSLIWLQGLACGALLTLATPTAVLGGALLAPGLLALALDRAPGRPVARTVLLFGLAATVHPLWTLWRSAGSVASALALAQDVSGLAAAWAAQGAGWLLTELVPLMVRVGLEAATAARFVRLKAQRNSLCEAWGFPSTPDDTPATGTAKMQNVSGKPP